MSEMRVVGLVLEGYYNEERKIINHLTAKRMVSVDLNKKEELDDIQRVSDWTIGTPCWGLRAKDGGWWKIVYAFEYIEPTSEMHDDKYPVSYNLTMVQFGDLIEEAKNAQKAS